jgi:hypothetical protein
MAYEVTNKTQRREGGKRKTNQFLDSIQEDFRPPQKNSKSDLAASTLVLSKEAWQKVLHLVK